MVLWRMKTGFILLALLGIPLFGVAQIIGPSDQSEAYFNGSSYIRLNTTVSLKKPTGLSFKTCIGGSLFTQNQNKHSIKLSVTKEGVIFYVKIDEQGYETKLIGDYLNNRWHTVYLRYQGNLTIDVDGSSEVIANATYNTELLTTLGHNEGDAVLVIGQSFNGCIVEGPSLVFNASLISINYNVRFESCPIPDNTCVPREDSSHFDYCLTEPCMRHGTCINGQSKYTCTCLPRYTGNNCQIDKGDPCEKSPSPCKNGAECISDPTGAYTCICPVGFAGGDCEHEIRIDPRCKTSRCQNGGTCEVSKDGEVECVCEPGFGGNLCELNLDECLSNPCRNGGVCNDETNNFTCDCDRTGYTGRFCEININECLAKPCLNRGICFDTYGSFMCQCQPGFGGSTCQYNITECSSQPCLNHGTCIDRPGSFECYCLPGFSGVLCEIGSRRFCDASSCLPYADCLETGNCVCKPEHPGVYPNCTDASCINNPCKNNGRCTSRNGSFECSCPSGFTGVYCERINDLCESDPCRNGGSCTVEPNNQSYKCRCAPGFGGENCERKSDDCLNKPCPAGMTCVDGDICTATGIGARENDPCSREPCSNNGSCVYNHKMQQISCHCPDGFEGPHCEFDVDECKTRDICNEGVCVNSLGSFRCYCTPGFTGDRCDLDFDECLSLPCKNSATCENQVNNYRCVCPAGYEGKDCSIDIDECAPAPCHAGSTCVDEINNFTCDCQPGMTGRLCDVNIDDCASSPCLHQAKCVDGLNNYTCDCTDTGYTGNQCETNIDDCESNYCENGAPCIDKVKDYECTCFPGYTGKNCEIDINECEVNPCQNSGTCYEKSNKTFYLSENDAFESYDGGYDVFGRPFRYENAAGYYCMCVPGVTGENCETNINECESSPCVHGNCIDKVGGFVCECEEGYEGDLCNVDIDECQKYTPCVHGRCVDRRANYFCDCDQNYGGKNCSVMLIGCLENPCRNNGTCKPYLVDEIDHRFNCSCSNGFHGQVCEKVTTMSLSGSSSITVNTSRDEGYDIQFRFKTTLGDGLLALGKGLTYYILELSKGRLNLHSSLLNKWEGVFIGSHLNDSHWQRVFVAINSTHLVLSANDEQTIYPITFNENYNVSSTSFPVTYIGGIPSNLRKLTHGQPFLVGCTEDILINGEWVLPEQNSTWLNFQNIDVGCIREPQCSPNPCHSGGHCKDMWRDFSCTCERPYLGHTCQYNYTAATFGYENITNSLVTVNVTDYARRAVRTIADISMFIRTRQSKGQIFYLGSPLGSQYSADDTYIAAELDVGELIARIQFNGTPESYTVGGVKLDNGYNHLIEVIRNVTLVQVKINGTEYFRKTISATGSLDAQVLFLGGQPQSRIVRQANDNLPSTTKVIDVPVAVPPTAAAIEKAALSDVHFKGIIQDVQISNGSSNMVVEFFPLRADVEIPMPFGEVSFDHDTVLEGIRSDNLCVVNPCLHDGVCLNTWNDYRCNCSLGFKGKNCSEYQFCELEHCPRGSECKNLENGFECLANATFDGYTAPLSYRFDSDDEVNLDSIEITYRTRSWGTVFYARRSDDYFAVFIYHNEVVVQWSVKEQSNVKRFKKDHFEGQWLTLYFTMKDAAFVGGFKDSVLDDSPSFRVKDFNAIGLIETIKGGTVFVAGSDETNTFDYHHIIDSSALYMAGYVPVETTTTPVLNSNSIDSSDFNAEDVSLYKVDQNKTTDRFKGCLSEIRVGGLLLPFFTVEQLNNDRTNLTHSIQNFLLDNATLPRIGCILCYESDCYNDGRCNSSEKVYRCDCPDGFAADDCSININECEDNKCENNATCVDEIAKYSCQCVQGYEGQFCESEVDECQSNPCQNGGTCKDLIGTFKCECPEGFVGRLCEAPLLITCDNKPCKSGAVCENGLNVETGNNFTCICSEGMEGLLCDKPFCKVTPCENGLCNVTEDVPFCLCEKGFEGKYCEVNIDDCVSPTGGSPCQNDGKCIDGVNRYTCNCTGTGYTGLLCEMDIDECGQSVQCGGEGVCINLPGSYACNCTDSRFCGHQCNLQDPCFGKNPCVNGECRSRCSGHADYVCLCKDNYVGKNCTDLKVAASASDGDINILYIVIPVLFAVLVAVLIGLVVLVNIARSKRATRGTYSPSAQEFCNPRIELDHVLKPPPEERLI